MVNEKIKTALRESGVKQWQVAECYGIHEGNFSRLLRHELPEESEQKILSIIESLRKEN